MHYYIDGYNLLFKISSVEKDFSAVRQQLIEQLNAKADAVSINVTIVFDAQYRLGEGSKSHYRHLEILYSGHKETADDLILEEVRMHKLPKQVTVVTSDKKLAWFARRCSAKTESIEQFLSWLEKRYQNKLRRAEQPMEEKQVEKPVVKKLPKLEKPAQKLRPEDCSDYYLREFEKRYQEEKLEKKTDRKTKKRTG